MNFHLRVFITRYGAKILVLDFKLTISLQEDIMSTGLKTLISVSTVFLLLLIVAYHMLEIQVECHFSRSLQFLHHAPFKPAVHD